MVPVNFLLLISFGAVFGFPAFDELMHEQGDDTAVVESVVREARAIGPQHIGELLGPGVTGAFIHTFGDKNADEGDQQGYVKKMQDKGNDGYKHFDSFHKKDSDKYGYEVHSEFGQANKAGVDVADENGKYSDEEKAEEDDGEETQHSYQVAEENEDKKNKKAVEDYGYFGDSGDKKNKKAVESYGFYGDSGDSEHYSEGEGDGNVEGESEHYAEGDGGSSNYEGGESESYSSDDGDSGSYTAEGGDSGDSEGYSEGGDESEY